MKTGLLVAITVFTTAFAKAPEKSPTKARIAWTEEKTKAFQDARDHAYLHHEANAENFNVRFKAVEKNSDTILVIRPTLAWTKATVEPFMKNNAPAWQQLGFQNIAFIHINAKTDKPEVFSSFKMNATPSPILKPTAQP